MMKVCVAGTFNVFHKGHKLLIDTAIQTAGKTGKIFIGITKGELLKKKKFLIPFEQREQAIRDYLNEKLFHRYEIIPIYDIYGLAIDGSYDAIIVSPETKENAQEINEKRMQKQKNPLEIISIPYILATDKKPISSTRILNNEIDVNGHIVNKKIETKKNSK